MRSAAARDTASVVPVLLRFVTSWLTFHILDADQSMARQIHAIQAGRSPAEAFEAEEGPADAGNAALLGAVHTLLGVVAARNEALATMNAELESRVETRTAELRKAEQRLVESERLAAIGQLGAGVAHEINNPLAFVGSNLGTLSDRITSYNVCYTKLLREYLRRPRHPLPWRLARAAAGAGRSRSGCRGWNPRRQAGC